MALNWFLNERRPTDLDYEGLQNMGLIFEELPRLYAVGRSFTGKRGEENPFLTVFQGQTVPFFTFDVGEYFGITPDVCCRRWQSIRD